MKEGEEECQVRRGEREGGVETTAEYDVCDWPGREARVKTLRRHLGLKADLKNSELFISNVFPLSNKVNQLAFFVVVESCQLYINKCFLVRVGIFWLKSFPTLKCMSEEGRLNASATG